MEELIYLNGSYLKKEDAKISVFDHGFLYGDGVFEGIRVYNQKIFKLKEHIDRLFASARAIMLNIPVNEEELAKIIKITVQKNNLTDAYVRVVVSRGEGTLGLDPFKCPNPNLIVIASKIQLYPKEFFEKGLAIITSSIVRNHPQALNPRIKSLNYLNNILAKIEAIKTGVMESLMLNHNGYVAECTGDNIFVVRNGKLFTPSENEGILAGITRNVVIEIARRQGIEVNEGRLSVYDIYSSDECFLTGTAAEVIPVVQIDGRKIGNGKPGNITKKIIEEFRKEIDKGESIWDV